MTEAASTLNELILASQHADGGWSYQPDGSSRIEPTAWVVLSLLSPIDTDRAPEHVIEAALVRLQRWQRADGLLADHPEAPANLAFNGLAILALHAARGCPSFKRLQLAESLSRARRAVFEVEPAPESWFVRTMRSVFPVLAIARQDNTLRGWPWNAETSTWIEPTAWCLLALKKTAARDASPAEHARLVEAERVFVDRVCLDGGWNAGNSNVLGQELRPYVPTTAIGLLALQRSPYRLAVMNSLRFLVRHRLAEDSPTALALTALCLSAHGEDNAAVVERLAARVSAPGPARNLMVSAMALYALTLENRNAFIL